MSLAWDPNSLDANKRALEAAMADEELMREISYLERDLEQKSREIKAENFAREHAKDIADYEELKTCYLKAAEEFSVSTKDVERSGSNARGPLLFWISLGLGIVLLAGYMLWRVM